MLAITWLSRPGKYIWLVTAGSQKSCWLTKRSDIFWRSAWNATWLWIMEKPWQKAGPLSMWPRREDQWLELSGERQTHRSSLLRLRLWRLKDMSSVRIHSPDLAMNKSHFIPTVSCGSHLTVMIKSQQHLSSRNNEIIKIHGGIEDKLNDHHILKFL